MSKKESEKYYIWRGLQLHEQIVHRYSYFEGRRLGIGTAPGRYFQLWLFASTNQHFDILCMLMQSKHALIFNRFERFRASL
jgi:hypothetical protein